MKMLVAVMNRRCAPVIRGSSLIIPLDVRQVAARPPPAAAIAFGPLEGAFNRSARLYEGLWRYLARLAAVIQISHSLMMKVRGDAVAPGRDLAATDRLNGNRRRKTSRFFTRARAAPLGLFLEPRK